MGEAASSKTVLIRKRPSAETAYSCFRVLAVTIRV